jgi:non-structural maintenance of chromosomes element 4
MPNAFISLYSRRLTVKGTNEATMDSGLLLKASMKSAMLARAMKSGGGAFDVDDFVSKLITFMGGRRNADMREDDEDDDLYDDNDGNDGTPLDWERVGWRAMSKSRRAPVMDFMYHFNTRLSSKSLMTVLG